MDLKQALSQSNGERSLKLTGRPEEKSKGPSRKFNEYPLQCVPVHPSSLEPCRTIDINEPGTKGRVLVIS